MILFDIVRYTIDVMVWFIIIRVFLSYIPHNPHNPILKFVYEVTQPLLGMISRVLPMSLQAPLDFTPVVALLVLQMLARPLLLNIIAAIVF